MFIAKFCLFLPKILLAQEQKKNNFANHSLDYPRLKGWILSVPAVLQKSLFSITIVKILPIKRFIPILATPNIRFKPFAEDVWDNKLGVAISDAGQEQDKNNKHASNDELLPEFYKQICVENNGGFGIGVVKRTAINIPEPLKVLVLASTRNEVLNDN